MTKIEYLQQYGVAIDAVRDIKSEIVEWEERKDGLGATRIEDGSRGTGGSDIIETAIQAVDDLILSYSLQILRLTDLCDTINKCINRACKNLREWRIMRMRYIRRMQWDEIEENIGLKKRQVQNIHAEVIEQLVIPKNLIAFDEMIKYD